MKATVTLELKTREVHHLFTRTINNKHLFIDAILHKLNQIAGAYQKETPHADVPYQSIQEDLQNLTQYLADQTQSLTATLQKNPILYNKTLTFKTQFFPVIRLESPLAFTLVACIEQYDKLVTTIKLLHLAGCFESTQAYYANIKCIQKMMNCGLSRIIVHH